MKQNNDLDFLTPSEINCFTFLKPPFSLHAKCKRLSP